MVKVGDLVELNLGMRYKEVAKGMLVGQCRQFPFIILKGKTINELGYQLFKHVEVYMNTFPKQGKQLLEKYGKVVESITEEEITNEIEQGWKHHDQLLTIPVARH